MFLFNLPKCDKLKPLMFFFTSFSIFVCFIGAFCQV